MEDQRKLRARGYGYNSHIRTRLTLEEQQRINKYEAFTIYGGITSPLQPSLEAQERRIHSEFWSNVAQKHRLMGDTNLINPHGDGNEVLALSFAEIDRQFQITGDVGAWQNQMANTLQVLSTYPALLSESDRYKDVPITVEDRRDYAEKKGLPPIQFSPEEELLHAWYTIELNTDFRYDPELGTMTNKPDWNAYWAERAFSKSVLDKHDPDLGQQLASHIDRNYTDLGKFFRTYKRDIQAVYRGIDVFASQQFTPEEQVIIRRSQNTSLEEQVELRKETTADGRLIISTWETIRRTAKKTWREANPDKEAIMLFFGDIKTASTDQAYQTYLALKSAYGIQK